MNGLKSLPRIRLPILSIHLDTPPEQVASLRVPGAAGATPVLHSCRPSLSNRRLRRAPARALALRVFRRAGNPEEAPYLEPQGSYAVG